MNPLQGFLHLLSDPNIAFILFTLGFYGLFFELQNPNCVTGILGAFAIILAFIGFGSLPLNIAGLLLVGLALILFLLEMTITSHGLLAVGGLVAFALGASAFYTQPGRPAGASGGRGLAHHRRHDRADGPGHRWPGRRWSCGTVVRPQLVMGASHITGPLVPLGTHGHGAARTCCPRAASTPRARNGRLERATAAGSTAARRSAW